MSRSRRPHPLFSLTVHAAVYSVAATMAVPFLWMTVTSLKTDSDALGGSLSLLPRTWEWSNYPRAIRSANLDRYYANSIIVSVVTTALAVAYNALAGYAFAKLRFGGRQILLSLTAATMLLPITVFFLFAYVICAWFGFLDNYQALIVPFLASGFGILYMRQAIASVPDSFLEAGRLDGMNDIDLFWVVVRPMAWPAIAALAIITFINAWNAFFWPLIVVDSDRMKTLPLAIAELGAGMYVQSWPIRMAAATIITAPLILIFLVFQRAFIRGVAMSGLKE